MFEIPKSNNYSLQNNITTASFINDSVKIHQFEYPSHLYKSELIQHNKSLDEYELEIYETFVESLELNKPNIELYKQQPYLTFSIRLKLIDFLLKMSIRLKILPFVFFKAVKIFDRYCSKRIVLLDQSQLIITTCLWIASKLQGGNNHFINLNNLDKLNSIKTINDLGYGSGGKFKGPTERFRLPKLHELVKLCGAKCKYDQGMFKQMELHVLSTLDWNFNDPSIEEFITYSHEFNVIKDNEFFKIKEFLSYISLYSYELIDINLIELSKVLVDLINETLNLTNQDYFYQRINYNKEITIEMSKYNFIKKNLIKSILNCSDFMLKLFNSKGPQQFFYSLNSIHRDPYTPPPSATSGGSTSSASSSIINKSNNSSNTNLHSNSISSTTSMNLNINNNSNNNSNNSSYIPPPHQLNSMNYNFQSPTSTPKNSIGAGIGGVVITGNSVPPVSAPPIISNDVSSTTNTVSPQPVFKPVVLSNLLKYNPANEILPNLVTTTSNNINEMNQINSNGGPPITHYNYKNFNHQPMNHHQLHHNSSSTSLNSSISSTKDHDYNSIFEYDPRKLGISTPLSDEESPTLPICKSNKFENVKSH